MTKTLAERHSTPVEIFHTCESLLQELSDIDSSIIHGGKSNSYSANDKFERKLLEYALVGFAIHNIVSLVKLFIDTSQQRSPAR